MARFSVQGVALLVLVIFVTNSIGAWTDCGSTLSQRLVRFNTLTAYPSPAIPGQNVHIVATYQAYTQLDETATVSMNIYYEGANDNMAQVLEVSNIPLCNFTSSVTCPVVATRNYTQTIAFDYLVPYVANGTYVFNYKIFLPIRSAAFGCVSFELDVDAGSSAQAANYASYYNAQLLGAAQYTQGNFGNRAVGDKIQVGPIGALGNTLPWGTFGPVTGSGDVIPPAFDATNYIWGLSGTLMSISSPSSGQTVQTYMGTFYVGYSGAYGSWNTLGNTLTYGNFTLSNQQSTSGNSSYYGTLRFLPAGGAFATGYLNPINFARLGTSTLQSDANGKLIAAGSTTTCLNNPTQSVCSTNNVVSQPTAQKDNRHLDIILPVVLGVFFILLIVAIILGVRYVNRRHRTVEDAVYNPRAGEYGSALVVDDIMQKSRGHSGAALPILDHSQKAFPPAYLEDYPAPVLPGPRTVRRTDRPREGRDRRRRDDRPRGRPAPRRPAAYTSESEFEPPLRDARTGTSRSRSPRGRDERSISPSDRSRSRSRSDSRSASSRSASRSRSMSRSRSPASGSSMSRSSMSEGPRR